MQVDNIHRNTAGAAEIAKKVKEMLVVSKPEITISGDKVVAPVGVDYQWYIDGGSCWCRRRREFERNESYKSGYL